MPDIPAICEDCGHACPSGVDITNCTYHILDQIVGECACGGSLRILDGTYSHLGGPLNYCRAPQEDLARFRDACRELGVPLHT